MNNYGIKVNYLHNSSFIIETKSHIIIFDYYFDKVERGIKNRINGAIGREDLETKKDILVFCSHGHGDHFSEVIFEWREINPNIKYILSSDINKNYSDINEISAYEELQINDVYVKAFGSTDIGISFLINVDGISIFHAGDLNWWHWYDESEEDNIKMEKLFKEEIDKLKGEAIDLVFFPVDSRLRDSYALGGEYFIGQIAPKIFIPMHFREDFSITNKFRHKNKGKVVKILEITHRGEEFIF